MSYFGKNIKKIRTIKKLTQSQFGDIFGITRASVGAYEEERSEPKLDVALQISKYFGLPLEHLIESSLQVNEILKIETLATNFVIDNNPDTIYYISVSNREKYALALKNNQLNNIPKVEIPWIQDKENYACFQISNKDNKLLKVGDILVAKKIDFQSLRVGRIYILVSKDSIIIDEIEEINQDVYLSNEQNFAFADIQSIYQPEFNFGDFAVKNVGGGLNFNKFISLITNS